MNQILITEKLYITPELKRKKKMYKFHFIFSVFLVCILTSFYIYAEYSRNKDEASSQDILADVSKALSQKDDSLANEDVLLIVLDGTDEDYEAYEAAEEGGNDSGSSRGRSGKSSVAEVNASAEVRTEANSGYRYKTIATVNIPKINTTYGVLQGLEGTLEETEALLKISPVKYHGCEPNEVGNFCIVGHNYRNSKFFSKVPTLVVGDTVELTDLTGRTITYVVYDKHTVDPADTRDTTQLTGGKKELTLITCTDDSKLRYVIKCKEVK